MKVFTYLTAALLILSNVVFAQSNKPEMILVEGGSYIMGNEYSDIPDERPEHKVSLKTFYMSKLEVTIGQYTDFCRSAGLNIPEGKEDVPMTNLSWENAIMYCNWISKTQALEKCYEIKRDSNKFMVTFIPNTNGYRLPTEAEWEYAARGGVKSKFYAFSGSNDADEVGWSIINSGNRAHAVGQKKPNELGIYDMTGNAMEWCYDWYKESYYAKSEEDNPIGPKTGVSKVCRGGNFMCRPDVLRNTRRFNLESNASEGLAGIRLVKNE